jgi:hypothetical protein
MLFNARECLLAEDLLGNYCLGKAFAIFSK